MYDPDNGKISYLAGDKLSIVSKLANYKSEFIRIYVLEEKMPIQRIYVRQ